MIPEEAALGAQQLLLTPVPHQEIPGQCREGLGTGGVSEQQLSHGLQCSPCSASTALVKPLRCGKESVGSG